MNELKGRISSVQTLGTLDGPGIRFVVFMQGCNLRCGCCHNPETWEIGGGSEYTVTEIADKCERYREYFGQKGGITLSGGEPLLQAEFAHELFKECHRRGINTCLDTSGSILNDNVRQLLSQTDTVLLDIKYTNDADYKKYVGCSMSAPMEFLSLLKEKNIPTVLRQVIIPTLNDSKENMQNLREIVKANPNIVKCELLAFKKLCSTKYDNLKLDFAFKNFDEPSRERINELEAMMK